VGRAIDVDLTDLQGQPVSSQILKPCLLCDQPALVCMRAQTHPYQELRAALTARMTAYLAQQQQAQVCKQLAGAAIKASLYEIAVSPKPGLVDRFDQGAHQDMDYFTFLDSSAALSGYFEELAVAGYTFTTADFTQALPLIREIGLKMEAAMFRATAGVNTQKGLIFLLGLALFASAQTMAQQGRFRAERCRKVIAAICRNLVQRELGVAGDGAAARDAPSHGECCFQHYGMACGGVRQEAEAGLPAVFEQGLPELRAQLATTSGRIPAAQMNAALTRTLLRLMTVVQDTNILYRQDLQTLQTLQQKTHQVLDAGQPEEAQARYADLIAYCRNHQISPGGSADLLAVTVFMYFVESAF
jgi:holo-ACP synthase / triphosphoribosyl-dephospho-CoA synthase